MWNAITIPTTSNSSSFRAGGCILHHCLCIPLTFDLWKAFMIAGSVLFAFADTPEKYWSHILPGMIVGTLGLAVSYVAANIAIITGSRPGQEAILSDSETLLVIVAELSFRSLGCGGCCYEHCFSDGCDDWHSWYVKKYYISSINYFHLE